MVFPWAHDSSLEDGRYSPSVIHTFSKFRKYILGGISLMWLSLAGINFLDLAGKLPEKYFNKNSTEILDQKSESPKKSRKNLEGYLGLTFVFFSAFAGSKAYSYHVLQKEYEDIHKYESY